MEMSTRVLHKAQQQTTRNNSGWKPAVMFPPDPRELCTTVVTVTAVFIWHPVVIVKVEIERLVVAVRVRVDRVIAAGSSLQRPIFFGFDIVVDCGQVLLRRFTVFSRLAFTILFRPSAILSNWRNRLNHPPFWCFDLLHHKTSKNSSLKRPKTPLQTKDYNTCCSCSCSAFFQCEDCNLLLTFSRSSKLLASHYSVLQTQFSLYSVSNWLRDERGKECGVDVQGIYIWS